VTPEPLRLRLLLERLRAAEVDFVLVGGLAVNAWGYVRATRDVDLVPDPSPENLARLDALLVELGGKVEVGGQLLESAAIKTFLRTGDRTLVLTDLGRVDVLQGLPQVPSFAALDARASEVDIDGLAVKVCSLDDLLAMKQASDRARDRDDLEALEAARGDDAPPDQPIETS
jgi:predicted nucleotidyltransferase